MRALILKLLSLLIYLNEVLHHICHPFLHLLRYYSIGRIPR